MMTETKGLEGADIEATPAVTPALPSVYSLPRDYLSHTQVNLWYICGERYYRRYVLGATEPPSSNQNHGKLVHHVIEQLNNYKLEHGGDMPPDDQGDDLVSDALAAHLDEVEVWDPKIPDKEVFETAARDLVKLYVQDRLPETRPRALEIQITHMVNGRVPYMGYIDMVERAEFDETPYKPFGGLHEIQSTDIITDLKNTGKTYGGHRVLNSLQLTMYTVPTGTSRVAFDLLVQTKKLQFVRQEALRSPTEKAHAEDVVEGIAKAISAGVFPKADPESWACSDKWCPFYADCRGRGLKHIVTKGLNDE